MPVGSNFQSYQNLTGSESDVSRFGLIFPVFLLGSLS